MWNALADDGFEAEMYRRTGLTADERLLIRPVAYLAEKIEEDRDAAGNWTVRGRFRARRYRDIGQALDAAGPEGEIEFRDMTGVVYSGLDPLAADKAARYEREHRASAAAERGRRKRLRKWLRSRRRAAEQAVLDRQDEETDS